MASNSNPKPSANIDNNTVSATDSPQTITFMITGSAPFFSGNSTIITRQKELLAGEEERKRVADIMEAGFHHLLSSANIKFPFEQTLLALQVWVGDERIQGKLIEDSAVVTTPHDAEHPTYEVNIEDAVGVLQDYAAFWNYSCSLVILGDLSALKKRVLSSDLRSRGKVNYDNQSNSNYTEVMLYIISTDGIDDKGILDSEAFMEFLDKLKEKNILKVHATCSKFTMMEEEEGSYTHLAIRDYVDLDE